MSPDVRRTLQERLLSDEGPEVCFLSDRDLSVTTERLSRATLRQRALAAAGVLARGGVRRGDRVVLVLGTSPDFIAWFLGVLAIGAVSVPSPSAEILATRAMIERVRSTIAAAKPAAVVAEPRVVTRLVRAGIDAPTWLTPDTATTERAIDRLDTSDIAFLQYTAGSTGQPKGVVVTPENLHANLTGIGEAVAVSADDRVLSWLPLHHDMGLIGALLFALFWRLPLFIGSPRGFISQPSAWLRAIAAKRATLSPAPHFAYSICAYKVPDAALAGVDLGCWRLALDGSEPIRAQGVERFIERFARFGFSPQAYFPVYGLAEATLAATMPPLGQGALIDRRGHARYVSVGRALPHHRLEIRDPESGAPLPDGTAGEIWIAGPSVSPRYFHEPQDVVREALRTGDLGYVEQGQLFVVDRLKDLIIRAGENYYPADLETLVEAIDGVRTGHSVAFSVPGTEDVSERLIIAAELRPGAKAATVAEEVRRALLASVGIAPDDVVLLPPRTLPRTPSGKRMRHYVRQLYLDGRLQAQAKILHKGALRRWLLRQLTRPG